MTADYIAPVFRASYWHKELESLIQAYWHFLFFVANTDAVEAYIQIHEGPREIDPQIKETMEESRKYVQSLNEDELQKYMEEQWRILDELSADMSMNDILPDDEYEENWVTMERQTILVNLSNAQEIFNHQMVVLTTTYIEVAIKDFVRCLFYSQPNLMTDYIGQGDRKGSVDLEKLVNAKNLENIWANLSKEAANRFDNGGTKDLFDRLCKMMPSAQLKQKIGQRIQYLVELRNKIVHEAHKPSIDSDDVRMVFITSLDFLNMLNSYAKKNGIQVDM